MGRRFGEHKEWGLRVNGAFTDGDTELSSQSNSGNWCLRDSTIAAGPEGIDRCLFQQRVTQRRHSGDVLDALHRADPDASVNQFPAAQGALESKAVIARAQYLFNANVSAFAGIGVRNHDFNGFINGTHVRNINAAGDSTNTVTVASRGYDNAVSSEAGVRLNFNTSTVAHEMVLQASYLALESGAASATSVSAPISTTRCTTPCRQPRPPHPRMPRTPSPASHW